VLCDRVAVGDGDAHAEPHAVRLADWHAHAYSDADSQPDAERHAERHALVDADALADAHADAVAHSHAHAVWIGICIADAQRVFERQPVCKHVPHSIADSLPDLLRISLRIRVRLAFRDNVPDADALEDWLPFSGRV